MVYIRGKNFLRRHKRGLDKNCYILSIKNFNVSASGLIKFIFNKYKLFSVFFLNNLRKYLFNLFNLKNMIEKLLQNIDLQIYRIVDGVKIQFYYAIINV